MWTHNILSVFICGCKTFVPFLHLKLRFQIYPAYSVDEASVTANMQKFYFFLFDYRLYTAAFSQAVLSACLH